MEQAKRSISRKAAKSKSSLKAAAAAAAPAKQMETIAENDLDDEPTHANQAVTARDLELGAAGATVVGPLGRKIKRKSTNFRNPDILLAPLGAGVTASAPKVKKARSKRGSADS